MNEWMKKAVILYFPIKKMNEIKVGPFVYHDKMELKTDYAETGVRVVPMASARYGSFLAKGVIMMPSYVNIGAYVDEGTMLSLIHIQMCIRDRLLPVVGAAVGAVANYQLLKKLGKTAMMAYRMRDQSLKTKD